jgi:hypothetical protein
MPSESLKGFRFLRAFKMENVLFQNKQWRVTKDFTIESVNGIYDIPIEMINSVDWLSHMEQKEWVKLNLFQQAYEFVIKWYKHG